MTACSGLSYPKIMTTLDHCLPQLLLSVFPYLLRKMHWRAIHTEQSQLLSFLSPSLPGLETQHFIKTIFIKLLLMSILANIHYNNMRLRILYSLGFYSSIPPWFSLNFPSFFLEMSSSVHQKTWAALIPLLLYDSSLPVSSSLIMRIDPGFSFLICKLGLVTALSYSDVIRTT